MRSIRSSNGIRGMLSDAARKSNTFDTIRQPRGNLTRISHRFVTIHNQVPLPLGEGAAKRRGRVNGVHSYRPSPGLGPPSPRGRGTRPPDSCPTFRSELRAKDLY